MRFRVGGDTCELSRHNAGKVLTAWFRRAEPPKYLNKAERQQYQAGRAAFLGSTGTGETTRAGKMKSRTSAFLAIVVAALLTGCARGGGIGLEAMVADHNCEAAGYQLGTPQYGACRMELARQSAINNAAMQAYHQRQQDWYWQQQNRQQNCIYFGSNNGGIIGGTMSCR